jgi:hypothetical protein
MTPLGGRAFDGPTSRIARRGVNAVRVGRVSIADGAAAGRDAARTSRVERVLSPSGLLRIPFGIELLQALARAGRSVKRVVDAFSSPDG